MKTVNEVLQQCQQSTKSEPQQTLDFETMKNFWVAMAEIYGHRWTSSYGHAPLPSWGKALSQFTAEQLKIGTERMLTENLQWPPTLTEFISYCQPPKREPCHQIAKLPEPPKRKTIGIGEQHLEKLWGLFGK